jgi:lipid II isoglutaminyl synthase (glutamine-hydrolysing)
MLLRMAPDAIARLGSRLNRGSAIVSATNGKTTTAGMISAALRAAGRTPVHNRAGSNMSWGVATALLDQHGEEGLFEVDEAWLRRIAAQLDPRLLTLGNLFRDQLDRYGELERLADDWGAIVTEHEGRAAFVLNADDPLVADLGRNAELERRAGVTYFGIDDERQALPALQHAHDAKHCRRCGAPYTYARSFVGHLGHYACSNCGADRPAPDVAATRIELDGMRGSTVKVTTPVGDAELRLPLPGLYNVYNALAALASALTLGVELDIAAQGIAATESAFGRVETIPIGAQRLSILLIKNPAGANEVLRTLKLEADEDGGGLDLWMALNDRIADGRDVSWIWDADFEVLEGAVRTVTCSGTRAPEMAVRLKYAGLPEDRIEVVDGIERSLKHALGRGGGTVFALPTYTALIELRRHLSARGLAEEFWR